MGVVNPPKGAPVVPRDRDQQPHTGSPFTPPNSELRRGEIASYHGVHDYAYHDPNRSSHGKGKSASAHTDYSYGKGGEGKQRGSNDWSRRDGEGKQRGSNDWSRR